MVRPVNLGAISAKAEEMQIPAREEAYEGAKGKCMAKRISFPQRSTIGITPHLHCISRAATGVTPSAKDDRRQKKMRQGRREA